MSNLRYTDEFKKQVVRYADSHELPFKDVAKHFKISSASLSIWYRKFIGDRQPVRRESGWYSLTPEQQEEIRSKWGKMSDAKAGEPYLSATTTRDHRVREGYPAYITPRIGITIKCLDAQEEGYIGVQDKRAWKEHGKISDMITGWTRSQELNDFIQYLENWKRAKRVYG